MSADKSAALRSFVTRMTARSVLSDEEVNALLGLKHQTVEISAHRDIVGLGDHVSHSCLVVDGLAGRFGQNREGGRQITCLHIPGDVADLVSVVSPRTGWGLWLWLRRRCSASPMPSFVIS
jgi:hypothetical protein